MIRIGEKSGGEEDSIFRPPTHPSLFRLKTSLSADPADQNPSVDAEPQLAGHRDRRSSYRFREKFPRHSENSRNFVTSCYDPSIWLLQKEQGFPVGCLIM